MMEIFRQTKAYQLVDGDLRQGRLSHAYLLLLPDAGSLGGCLRVLAQRILTDGLAQGEDILTVLGAGEDVRRRLINGDGPGSRRRIGNLSGVLLQCFKFIGVDRVHDVFLPL